MPLKLIRPGQRKGNPYFIIRGKVGGRRVEVSTKTTDREAAQALADELAVELRKQGSADAAPVTTFAEAAERYIEAHQPDRRDIGWIRALKHELGSRELATIVSDDFKRTARKLYPDQAPSSLNRKGVAPGVAVMHYAAENKWCAYHRFKRFAEADPVNRTVPIDTLGKLLVALEAGPTWPAEDGRWIQTLAARRKKRLLLLWLFAQGDRITDILKVDWEANIDLRNRRIGRMVGKVKRWAWFPLDDVVFEELANWPEDERKGRLFGNWGGRRENVYKWLKPLCEAAGVAFTPHMARHTVGTALGGDLRNVMDKLGHTTAKASLRYNHGHIERVRHASADLTAEVAAQATARTVGETVGENRAKRRKA